MLNRLQGVFSYLQKHEVKYVVIGGITSVLHGVPRATFFWIFLKGRQGQMESRTDCGSETVMAMKKKFTGGVVLLGLLGWAIVLLTGCSPALPQRQISLDAPTETRGELSGVKVAIYFGDGMDRHSARAMEMAFQWMGCQVEMINADEIKNDRLDNFEVLGFPGGESNPDPWGELGLEGKEKIQKFISEGGGYIGICLGALYASDDGDFWNDQIKVGEEELYLDLFPGVAYCGQEEIAPQGVWPLMTWLDLSDRTHPIADSLPERMKIVYYPSSPYLQPYDSSDVTIVATYATTGNPAMVAFDYGNGKVFLSGPHPEIEVDSDRDGSNAFQELSDEGSEWPLLLEVMKWLTAR